MPRISARSDEIAARVPIDLRRKIRLQEGSLCTGWLISRAVGVALGLVGSRVRLPAPGPPPPSGDPEPSPATPPAPLPESLRPFHPTVCQASHSPHLRTLCNPAPPLAAYSIETLPDEAQRGPDPPNPARTSRKPRKHSALFRPVSSPQTPRRAPAASVRRQTRRSAPRRSRNTPLL
jgi:hypothetical protein